MWEEVEGTESLHQLKHFTGVHDFLRGRSYCLPSSSSASCCERIACYDEDAKEHQFMRIAEMEVAKYQIELKRSRIKDLANN